MALINCPECGKEISDLAYACPKCGYQLQANNPIATEPVEKKSVNRIKLFINNNRILVGAICLCLAIMFLIIAIVRLNDHSYKFSVENLSYYKSQYEETSSMTYGWLSSTYKSIANEWKRMYDEALVEIWFTRIMSGVLVLADIPLVIFGVKSIKKGRVKNGTDQLS